MPIFDMIRTQTRAACTGLFLYALWRENNCLFVNKKQAASHKAACGQNEYSDLVFLEVKAAFG
ncbi:MAG: hypothetical protein II679_04900 [Ruminococcus sp.]|nr:hypothetical protein [Ruminococcus sp.]